MSQTGSYAPNLHEGSRSEYLAHYVFAAFGTSVPVPHQEDSGLDLICTLAERVGRRAWPRYHYAVQVKSNPDPWRFEGPDSVRWFIEYPTPLFFCVVDKATSRLQVFQTSARFKAWSDAEDRDHLSVVPGSGVDGKPPEWKEFYELSLSAPILDFSIADLHSDEFVNLAWSILAAWAERDERNIHNIRCHRREVQTPTAYTTNKLPGKSSSTIQGIKHLGETDLRETVNRQKHDVVYAAKHLFRAGRTREAIRAMMYLRCLSPGPEPSAIGDIWWAIEIAIAINKAMELSLTGSELVLGIDALNDLIDERLPPATLTGR